MNSLNNFLDSEYPQTDIDNARFHIIPVPLEATVSYGGGTSKGPEAILAASTQLEKQIEQYGEPGALGMHTHHAIDCNYKSSVQEVFNRIQNKISTIRKNHNIPILLGGEHSITNGMINYLAIKEEPEPIGMIQFDAHMDLRNDYEGSIYSHACVMRRAVESGIPLFQVGIRNFTDEELGIRNRYLVRNIDASMIDRLNHSNERFSRLSLPDNFPKQLYITFDVDAFDASLMPATGTPEPGGLQWWDAVLLLEQLTKGRTIMGFDVVELAPVPHLHHCDYVAAKITYFLMGLTARRNQYLHDHISF